MITLYITIGFFALLTGFLIYKKKKVAALIFGVITAVSVLSTVQMYKSAVELNDQPISQRRGQIISVALMTATQSPAGLNFIKLVEFASKDNVITNAEYNQLRPFIPNEVIAEVNSKYPDAEAEERHYSRTTLLQEQ
ncbi:hypothetical protein HYG89_04685 [Acinetobacter sp. SwsAc5]|uniref:hypothetical protein n=1 Tax=Acinetobacter sp. SwsAc5 TaxID=2749438 RepID=UPI0015B968AE|nr:hypothetical protein [Acinetobacter sp. SwsAc5]NWK51861.1 hypothetical protein [Acinetobacter sp. SwsAc5]